VGFIHTALIHDEKSSGLEGRGRRGFLRRFKFLFLIGKNCGVKKYGVFLSCYFAKNTDGGTPMG
jgi:NADH:ubiquinone oxidoreductase subunit F (NADH-binding)